MLKRIFRSPVFQRFRPGRKLQPEKYVLSIAGFDPSGGAGVMADAKVFEQLGIGGLGVTTCITYQNDEEFTGVKWLSKKEILDQLIPLTKFRVEAVKIGLVENLEVLQWLLPELKKHWKKTKIVWDPISKASAGFTFHPAMDRKILQQILKKVECITPNLEEAELMGQGSAMENALTLSKSCFVLLKGGHATQDANDVLLRKGKIVVQFPQAKLEGVNKHGSGCVYASALAATLAKGARIEDACLDAKDYTLAFLRSTDTLLGKHKGVEVKG